MFTRYRLTALSGAVLLSLSLTACNGSSSSTTASTSTTTTPTVTYTVGGSITGLAAGQSVTLLDNGGDGYVATANGTFMFATPLAAGATYAVTVGTQPSGQKCTVTNGSGIMGSTNVSSISVSCLNLGYSPIYSFGFTTTNDGANPYAALITDASGNLYGTTAHGGGTSGYGTVFKIDASGTETVLYSFKDTPANDGSNPYGGLIMDASGNLYGTTYNGGVNNTGTLFKIDTSGNETVLHSFTGGSDGANPFAGLILDASGNLYGTTVHGGGTSGYGTVFKIDASGTETVLYSFKDTPANDGSNPYGGLIMDASGNLYGTTFGGGTTSRGTVFKLDTGGTETVLHSFSGGSDGQYPYAGLVMDASGNLYGTTGFGGTNSNGTVFKIDTSGTETVLHSFGSGSDGQNPWGGLIQDAGGNLYGTTYNGGVNNTGTLFKIDTSGTETVLYSFTGGSDGAYPVAGLLMDASGNLYGTTVHGGANSFGMVFRYVLP